MIRYDCQPRPDFLKLVESQGLVYHTNADGKPYWTEQAYCSFSSGEIEELYATAKELHQMFLAAAEHVLQRKNGLLELGIPGSLHDVIRRSWENEEWEFYGRFDLTLNAQGTPKLIEYNADTPTGLLEASIIQWFWKEDRFPRMDQFNSIHEGLVNRWKELLEHRQISREIMHFTSVADHPEDRMTVGYVAKTAEEAGIPTDHLSIDLVGWNSAEQIFVDEENRAIRQLFKLYPWEWLGAEAFSANLSLAKWMVFEPAWKTIFASKRLLLVLQELYPDHPNLLQVSDQPLLGNYVSKPVFGREGANVTVYKNGAVAEERKGPEGKQDFIYQDYCSLVKAKPGIFAQCGVWMAGPEPVGLGIREDDCSILSNTSRFMPHVIR